MEKALRECLKLTRQLATDDDDLLVAMCMSGLGITLQEQGKLDEAETLFQDALNMTKRLFKSDHEQVASNINSLAMLYKSQGKLSEAESLVKDSLEMRKRLSRATTLSWRRVWNNLGMVYKDQFKLTLSEQSLKESQEMLMRLYKGDNIHLASCLNNLGMLYMAQGNLSLAQSRLTDSLEMQKRLFKGDHIEVAKSLSNLALLYQAQGKLLIAERPCKEALEMRMRLTKGDNRDLALNMSNLASLYKDQGKLPESEHLYKEVLDMHKRLFNGDHPDVAYSLSNLATLFLIQGKFSEAEPLFKESLDMYKRVLKGDHLHLAICLNNLAFLYKSQYKLPEAESLIKNSLAMLKRLFKEDHPYVANLLNNLAHLYQTQGKLLEAETLYKQSLEMSRRHISTYAMQTCEGEALTLAAFLPHYRDAFISTTLRRKTDPTTVYPEVWASKGVVSRIYEQDHQKARAATDPNAVELLSKLADARRHRAELLLAPHSPDSTTQKQRAADLKKLDDTIADLNAKVTPLLPAIARGTRLATAKPAELQKLLPADTAVVDFIRYVHSEYDLQKTGAAAEMLSPRYLAFVIRRDAVKWVEINTADKIESAVLAWREAISSGKDIPTAIPARVRDLVWCNIRKELPGEIKTLYISPDAALCKLPWAALPGDKPGTILLEDFAVTTIPHAQFLLDNLWPPVPVKNPPTFALVVGGVKYDAELNVPSPLARASRGDPLLKPDAISLNWSFLPGTVGELNGVATLARQKNISTICMEGDQASSSAVLATLSKAKFAHFTSTRVFWPMLRSRLPSSN